MDTTVSRPNLSPGDQSSGTPIDLMRADHPRDDPALDIFKADALAQGIPFRRYARMYGIVIMAAEQDRRQHEVMSTDNLPGSDTGDPKEEQW